MGSICCGATISTREEADSCERPGRSRVGCSVGIDTKDPTPWLPTTDGAAGQSAAVRVAAPSHYWDEPTIVVMPRVLSLMPSSRLAWRST